MTPVKVCGLTTPDAVRAAVEGGAAYVGFVFFDRSPRAIAPERAAALARPARVAGLEVVAVTVDPDDALLDRLTATLRPELIQLHGHETPERMTAVKARTGARVVRALRVSTPADLDAAATIEPLADHLMFDAKPPEGARLPGGNGAAFDWAMLAHRRFARPWFLAGGLTPDTVAKAIRVSGAPMVDVSSGVESAPGVKHPALIAAFLKAVSRA